ncbi:MAG: glycosyltransferase [Pseudolabrys sp.]|nr:glycosyltransferase [Pseudolabrys sp.]
MTAPRVLAVVPRLGIGGTEMHLLRVVPELRRRGLDVSLFVLERGGRLEPEFALRGIPLHGPSARGAGLARILAATGALRGELRRARPDIVHFFLPESYLVGSLAAAGLGGMIRIMSRRSLADYQRGHPVLARIERRLHGASDALIGNSTAVVEELVAECGAPAKVGLLHNGVDIPAPLSARQRAEARDRLAVPHEAMVLVVPANFFPYKGHRDLLEALALLRADLGGAWRLLLLGRDEGAMASVRRLAATLDLGANILWLGEATDIRGALAAADIGVLPSHQEGFSNSLLEMMACGLAVVATAVGGNRDAIVDCESGLLVPPKQPAALAAAIARLSACAGLRARLGEAARARVSAQFSLAACVQRYHNLYHNILRGVPLAVQALIDTVPASAGGRA